MVIASITIGLLVYLAVGVSTTDGALVKGRCPNVKGQENFDIDQYMGKWYMLESFANPFFLHDNCISVIYTPTGDGKIRLLFNDNNLHSSKLFIQDSSDPAILHFHLSEDDQQHASVSNIVVFTDYKNYRVEFSCLDLVGDHSIQYAWISTREKEADPDKMAALKARIQSLGIDITNFKTLGQSNCD